MTEYTEQVDRQRLLNDALEWGNGVKYIHYNNGIEETRFNNGSYKLTNPKPGIFVGLPFERKHKK